MSIPVDSFLRNYLLGIMLAAPLGPASVAVIQTGLRRGFLRAFITGLGVTLADTTYLLLVYFGLSRFTTVTWVRVLIWLFGALVLVYLGVQGVRGFKQLAGSEQLSAASGQQTANSEQRSAVSDPPTTGARRVMAADSRSPLLVGYLVNISNPMAAVFWLGIFGAMAGAAAAGGSATQAGALLGGFTILLGILTWHTSMALLTHWGGRLLNDRSLHYVSLVAGLALIFFGLRFAWFALAAIFG